MEVILYNVYRITFTGTDYSQELGYQSQDVQKVAVGASRIAGFWLILQERDTGVKSERASYKATGIANTWMLKILLI